jgi:hypothetical protein
MVCERLRRIRWTITIWTNALDNKSSTAARLRRGTSRVRAFESSSQPDLSTSALTFANGYYSEKYHQTRHIPRHRSSSRWFSRHLPPGRNDTDGAAVRVIASRRVRQAGYAGPHFLHIPEYVPSYPLSGVY